jgi:hypothetical protein
LIVYIGEYVEAAITLMKIKRQNTLLIFDTKCHKRENGIEVIRGEAIVLLSNLKQNISIT